jgi:hypothetical protein
VQRLNIKSALEENAILEFLILYEHWIKFFRLFHRIIHKMLGPNIKKIVAEDRNLGIKESRNQGRS